MSLTTQGEAPGRANLFRVNSSQAKGLYAPSTLTSTYAAKDLEEASLARATSLNSPASAAVAEVSFTGPGSLGTYPLPSAGQPGLPPAVTREVSFTPPAPAATGTRGPFSSTLPHGWS